jgi:hypothetical protein
VICKFKIIYYLRTTTQSLLSQFTARDKTSQLTPHTFWFPLDRSSVFVTFLLQHEGAVVIVVIHYCNCQVVIVVIHYCNCEVENQIQSSKPICSRFGRITRWCRLEREGLRVCTAIRHCREHDGIDQGRRASTSVWCLGCGCRLHGDRFRNARFV